MLLPTAAALGWIGDARATWPLVRALSDEYLQLTAAEALGRIAQRAPDPRMRDVIPRLRHLSRWAPWERQCEVYRTALQRIEEATAALKDLPLPSTAATPSARWLAPTGRGKSAGVLIACPSPREPRSHLWIRDKRQPQPSRSGGASRGHSTGMADMDADMDEVADNINRLMTHGDPEARWTAARVLGFSGDARAVPPLIAATQDASSRVRREAVVALGRSGDTRAIPPLVAVVSVRASALQSVAGDALRVLGVGATAVPVSLDDLDQIAPLLRSIRAGERLSEEVPGLSSGADGDARILFLAQTLADQDEALPWLAAAEALGQIAMRAPVVSLRSVLPCLHALADYAPQKDRPAIWTAIQRIEEATTPLRDLPLAAKSALAFCPQSARAGRCAAIGRRRPACPVGCHAPA